MLDLYLFMFVLFLFTIFWQLFTLLVSLVLTLFAFLFASYSMSIVSDIFSLFLHKPYFDEYALDSIFSHPSLIATSNQGHVRSFAEKGHIERKPFCFANLPKRGVCNGCEVP